MKRFSEESKFESIAMLSHKIKGSAPTFGLEDIGRLAEMLEEQAEKSSQQDVSNLITQMEMEVKGAIEKLN